MQLWGLELYDGAHVAQLAGMEEFGSRRIRSDEMANPKPEKSLEPKVIIILGEFHKQFPNIREEISAWILDNPGESQLKDFLFNILAETKTK